jgi:hypothetical protein
LRAFRIFCRGFGIQFVFEFRGIDFGREPSEKLHPLFFIAPVSGCSFVGFGLEPILIGLGGMAKRSAAMPNRDRFLVFGNLWEQAATPRGRNSESRE